MQLLSPIRLLNTLLPLWLWCDVKHTFAISVCSKEHALIILFSVLLCNNIYVSVKLLNCHVFLVLGLYRTNSKRICGFYGADCWSITFILKMATAMFYQTFSTFEAVHFRNLKLLIKIQSLKPKARRYLRNIRRISILASEESYSPWKSPVTQNCPLQTIWRK